MQMSGSDENKDENDPQHVRKWTDRIHTPVLPKRGHSKAENILNLYKMSTKYHTFIVMLL